jgi:hypothetical protein
MRYQDTGDIHLLHSVHQKLAYLPATSRIKARCWLIKHYELRPLNYRTGYQNTLQFASTQLW